MRLLPSLRRLLRLEAPAPTYPFRPLFTRGDTAYELLYSLRDGHHAERWLLVREHTRVGPGRQLVLQELGCRASRTDPRGWNWPLEPVHRALRLNHPNIPRLHGLHMEEDYPRLWALLDEVPEGSLETAWLGARELGHCFSEAFVLYVGREVAGALHHAHTLTDEQGRPAGMVHGELHPSCIRLAPGGEVRLLNLGFSHLLVELAGKRTRLPPPTSAASPLRNSWADNPWMGARTCSPSGGCCWGS